MWGDFWLFPSLVFSVLLVPHTLFLISVSLSANDSIYIYETIGSAEVYSHEVEYTWIGLNGEQCSVNINNLLWWACGFLCTACCCCMVAMAHIDPLLPPQIHVQPVNLPVLVNVTLGSWKYVPWMVGMRLCTFFSILLYSTWGLFGGYHYQHLCEQSR